MRVNFFTDSKSKISSTEVIKDVKNLINKLCLTVDKKDGRNNTALTLFKIHIRSNIASKPIITKNINRDQFDYILEEIDNQFHKSVVPPGEMCGVLAAQSLGEP